MRQIIKNKKGWFCVIVILFQCTCTVLGGNGAYFDTNVDSIYAYLNDDKCYDLIVLESEDGMAANLKLTIYFGAEHGYVLKKDISYIHEGITSRPIIEVDSSQNICITYSHYRGPTYIKTYKYFKSRDDWFLYYEEEFGEFCDKFIDSNNFCPLYCTEAIGDENGECVNLVTKSQHDSLVQNLNKQYALFLNEYETNKFEKLYNYKLDDFYAILRYIGINESNVQKINDIGFFLVKAGRYDMAVTILKGITYQFNERAVAYINLGDAYWGLEENDKAKETHKKYIGLMKANGKESKIPQRVFDRIK